MSKFLLELALPHATMMDYLPSMQAAAALHLAREIFQVEGGWNATIAFYTGYSFEAIAACVGALQAIVKDAPTSPYQCVQKKWNHTRFFHLSQSSEFLGYVAALQAPPA